MKIEYICHACLLIDTGDVKIVTDPWFNGPAYCGQWHVFPKPVKTDHLQEADVILLSHGHEDHMHAPTLETLPKKARVLYPYNWHYGTKPWLESKGFQQVTEAPTGKTFRLSDSTSVTFVANKLDSIMVIESDGQVFVNANDALHAHHHGVIDAFVNALKQKWPRIDTLFCGFGGASYFPNTLHCVGKDDWEIGKLREQLFAHNFVRITEGLKPAVAVPFAADFALLNDDQRWINEVRFPRSLLPDLYERYSTAPGSDVAINPMYPGDVLEDNRLKPSSAYRAQLQDGKLDHLLDEQYSSEIESRRVAKMIDDADAEQLRGQIAANVAARHGLFDPAVIEKVNFCVQVNDVAKRNCYQVVGGSVERRQAPSRKSLLVMKTSSKVLRYSFGGEWGGDAITIGYGCEIEINDPEAIDTGLDKVCVRLMTRHPVATSHMKHHPIRAIRYLAGNPLTRQWAIKRALNLDKHEDRTIHGNHWLLRTKCEVCQICNVPLLDYEFGETLVEP